MLGMVHCTVERLGPTWLVTLADHSTMLLQSDFDKGSFAEMCGALKAPENWDGNPGALIGWNELDATKITQCSDEYEGEVDEAASAFWERWHARRRNE